MDSTPRTVPPVQDYMSYFTAAKKYPFNGNYVITLAPYIMGVAAPTDVPDLTDVSQKNYSESGDALTDVLLWIATPGVADHVDTIRIVLLHSVS